MIETGTIANLKRNWQPALIDYILCVEREVTDLSEQQINEFAGNAIELSTDSGRVLALSARAAASLRPEQISIIERSARILPLSVPTIEMAGGSVRCMLAGIHLTRR